MKGIEKTRRLTTGQKRADTVFIRVFKRSFEGNELQQ